MTGCTSHFLFFVLAYFKLSTIYLLLNTALYEIIKGALLVGFFQLFVGFAVAAIRL
jgi:hypothetical protein